MGGVPAAAWLLVNDRLKLAVGVLSTGTFLGLGALMLAEQRTGLGAVFLAAGLLRGSVLARQYLGGDDTPAPPPG